MNYTAQYIIKEVKMFKIIVITMLLISIFKTPVYQTKILESFEFISNSNMDFKEAIAQSSKDDIVTIASKITTKLDEYENLVLDGTTKVETDNYFVYPRLLEYKKNAFIVYPQIVFKNDDKMGITLNTLIISRILCDNGSISALFQSDDGFTPCLTGDDVMTYLEYEITYSTPRILSFRFWGKYVDTIVDDAIVNSITQCSEKHADIMPAMVYDLENGIELFIEDVIINTEEILNELPQRSILNCTHKSSLNYYMNFNKCIYNIEYNCFILAEFSKYMSQNIKSIGSYTKSKGYYGVFADEYNSLYFRRRNIYYQK